MDIKPLEELQAADERSLRFTPLGLGQMQPEDAADFQQRVIAGLRLADDVTEQPDTSSSSCAPLTATECSATNCSHWWQTWPG